MRCNSLRSAAALVWIEVMRVSTALMLVSACASVPVLAPAPAPVLATVPVTVPVPATVPVTVPVLASAPEETTAALCTTPANQGSSSR